MDSLYSQPGVMSVPRALKLTLIAALKIITKQQEAADVLGQCRVVEDALMFSGKSTAVAVYFPTGNVDQGLDGASPSFYFNGKLN